MSTAKKATPPPPIDECLQGDNSTETISLATLRRIASLGICDSTSCRGLAWRVLLGYLPVDRQVWPLLLEEKRSLYTTLVNQVFSSCRDVENGEELMGPHGKQAAQHEERRQAQQDIDDVVLGVKKVGLAKDVNVNAAVAVVSGTDEKEKETTVSVSSNGCVEEETTAIAASSITKNGSAECVPLRIREQWKKSGRDSNILVEMSHATGKHINTLLVVDNNGKAIIHHDDDEEEEDDTHQYSTDGQWNVFFQNASLLDEIRKDVVRTHPDLKFFLDPTNNLGCRRYAAMERILFVWAKLNHGVRYVQGMNEIVGTMYFVLANDFYPEWACHAEADTYFLFSKLMEEMSDIFVPAMDNADTGIQGRINNMNALLKIHDPEVAGHLEEVGIHASFYAIRWLTTLLSREFLLPDTIRLWDSMFASTHKDNFLRYVCVTMVMVIRDDLLKGDFSSCLRLLQSYPPTNLDSLLESSRALWIYESQITLACHKGGISLSQALFTISPPPAVVMAYGLAGGVAIRRLTLPNTAVAGAATFEQQTEVDVASTTTASVQGRAFLTGAKDFLGGLGREAARRRNDYRSNANNNNNNNTTTKE